MPRSLTARDAAEGLAEIEDVLAEHMAGNISGSLAASTIGLMFLKHQGPLLAALRSAGTDGGEMQGAGTPERALRDGLSPDGRTATRSEPSAFDPARGPDEPVVIKRKGYREYYRYPGRGSALTLKGAYVYSRKHAEETLRKNKYDDDFEILTVAEASGIEARSAETRSGLAEGESPTPPGVMPEPTLRTRTTDGGEA